MKLRLGCKKSRNLSVSSALSTESRSAAPWQLAAQPQLGAVSGAGAGLINYLFLIRELLNYFTIHHDYTQTHKHSIQVLQLGENFRGTAKM